MRDLISRRKFIVLSAAAGGAGLVPLGSSRAAAAAAPPVEWTGVVLGALSTMRLHHPDREAGKRIIQRAVAEAHRLEGIFSLYRTDTALSELNRRGVLVAPPAELVELLDLCNRLWHDTDGTFDPSVQPLWRCYADHFSATGADPRGPAPERLAAALELVGWRNVQASRNRIVFARRGMGLTLNGIAQGYITDRIVRLLREEGIESSLVDMGEISALGRRPDGQPWRAAIEGAAQGEPQRSLDLVDKAVATSAADGFRFTPDARCNHLFNPATGGCAAPSRALTVVANDAATADALSTAGTLMDEKALAALAVRRADVSIFSA